MAKGNKNELGWSVYENGLDYQTAMGFTSKWPELVRFYDSDQWPAPTPNTATMPRPVFNIIEYLIRHKRAYLLAQKQRMLFLPEDTRGEEDEAIQAAQDFTDFVEMTWDDCEFDRITERVMLSSPITGTGIWHYYWDASHSGGTYTKYKGKIQCEYIRPHCFFVSNPQCEDEQKQQHIVIASREETAYVKEMAKAAGATPEMLDLIRPDSVNGSEGRFDAEKEEQRGTDKTTYLTHYYRENGEVMWEKVVRGGKIVTPRRLNGNKLYPVVVNNWTEREGCIYGFGEAEGLIPAQKAINFMYALHLISTQNMSMPKIILSPGALQNQKITNVVGETLIDYSGDPNGIRFLTPPPSSEAPIRISEALITLVRTLRGVTEVISADRMVSDMAAAAIMALQSQAKMPMEFQMKRLQRNHYRTGRIWEEFFKNFQTLPRPFMVKNAIGKEVTKIFQGEKHKDKSFRLRIEVGPSATFGDEMQQTTLDRLFYEKGEIDLKTYLQTIPPNALPNKDQLLKILQEQADQSGLIEEMIMNGDISPAAAGVLAEAGIFPKSMLEKIDMIMQEQQMTMQAQQGGEEEMPPMPPDQMGAEEEQEPPLMNQ